LNLWLDRLDEEADTVVAIGTGEPAHKSGAINKFAFSTSLRSIVP
jgi:hypothetical protein